MEWLKHLAVYNDGECILVNGKHQGYQYIRHADGKLRNSYHYVDGIQHGVQYVWYEDGTLYYEGNYNHGKRNGRRYVWSRNTGQIVDVMFINDVMLPW
jgi:antitoxin component YwqK of YwqJK toxin-antitoxin module